MLLTFENFLVDLYLLPEACVGEVGALRDGEVAEGGPQPGQLHHSLITHSTTLTHTQLTQLWTVRRNSLQTNIYKYHKILWEAKKVILLKAYTFKY